MKLIGVHLSPFVRKVAVMLTHKGLEYEQEVVIPGMFPPGFEKISPLMKIPVLQDGDFLLTESSVIGEYLEEKFPSPPMFPAGVEARAQARFLEKYGDGKFTELTAVPFRENFMNPTLRNIEPDTARVQKVVEEELPPLLDYLESRMPEDDFLFGDFCVADIALTSPMINAAVGGYEPDATRWPKFAAFLERVKAYEPVAKVLEVEREAMSGMLGG